MQVTKENICEGLRVTCIAQGGQEYGTIQKVNNKFTVRLDCNKVTKPIRFSSKSNSFEASYKPCNHDVKITISHINTTDDEARANELSYLRTLPHKELIASLLAECNS